MSLIVHLSDLHIAHDPARQSELFEKLVETVGRERMAEASDPVLLVITGDVFDSATDPAQALIDRFTYLHRRLIAVLGEDVPTIVLPGNHDRRQMGFIGPHREGLFRRLKASVDPRTVYVAGCRTPFLAEVVPSHFHRLPAHVIAYDTTYLPRGLVSAGGTVRIEDLLRAHAQLPHDGLPVLLLVHHHLVPTPITDLSRVDSVGTTQRLTRWLLSTALPALISNADREELTMTALGAGTALSTLHTLERAVVLLHGHKHVPTARLVCGMTPDSGDVLLASAGTAGRREAVTGLHHPEAARLWPSFNRVDLSGERVVVQSVSFSPKRSRRPPILRHLASVERRGLKWILQPCTLGARDPAPRVSTDEATFALVPSTNPQRWDLGCERRVELREGARLPQYVDFVHALPRSSRLRPSRARRGRIGRRVELRIGEVTTTRLHQALCRTLGEARRCYGAADVAFEWVCLLCRYGATRATLRLARNDAPDLEPFGSITDLTTGRERPSPVHLEGDHWIVVAQECAPRTLLRIYWPLAAD
jgi:3',5'-cyclic AMP phosphodiesterase CpdA